MATTVNITNSFKGTDKKELFLEIYKQADTLNKNLITVSTGVIGSYYLPTLSFSPEMRLVTGCGWNPTGTANLAEKEIIVKKYEFASELCKEQFYKTFQAQNEGLFSAHAEVPKTIEEAFLSLMVSAIGEKIDFEIWQGNGSTHSFSGLIPQFVADATVQKVAGATAISAANVVAEMSKLDELVIPELDGSNDTVWVVSRNVGKAYKKAQNAMGMNTTVGDKELDYMGTRLEVINGLPNNFMAVYEVPNLHLACGIGREEEEIRVTDSDAVNFDGILKYQAKLLAAVGYVDGSRIAIYRG